MGTPKNPALVGPYRCGRGQPLLLIAGPCVIESEELTLSIARRLKEIVGGLAGAAGVQGVVRQGQSDERGGVSRGGAGRGAGGAGQVKRKRACR